MDVSQVENTKRRTSPILNVVSCLCSDHVPCPAHSIRFQKQDGYMTGPPVHGARQHPAADSRLALPTPQSARSKIEQASMFSNSTDPNTRLCPKWSLHPLQRGTTPCVQKLKSPLLCLTNQLSFIAWLEQPHSCILSLMKPKNYGKDNDTMPIQ